MNDALTPANRPDYQPVEPVGDHEATASRIKLMRFLFFLLKYWWIPVVTLVLGFVAEAAYVYWKVPTFVSQASMWETVKMSLPGGEFFSEDVQDFLGTQSALLQSETLRQQALARLKDSANNAAIVVDKYGEPLVGIRVTGSAKSSVFSIQATSSNPLFTQTYLDALMGAYLDYKRNVRKEVSGGTLTSISEQVQRTEQDLKTEQDALLTFQQTNNLAILEEEAAISGSYLEKLKTELSDLQLEARLLNATKNDQNLAATDPGAMTSGLTSQSTDATDSKERLSSYREIELLKAQREKLSKYLRPKHPKIVKLDADIERGEKMQEIFQKQNLEQLAAAQQANQLKTDNVLASIREWETKVVAANTLISEGERLKVDVQRTQSVYDRLTQLVENVDISRNIDQESLAILEHASPAKRSYASEKAGLTMAILGGLGAGLGIIALIAIRDDRFTSVTEVNSMLGDAVVGILPEVNQETNGVVPLLQLDDLRHIYAESYRSLRSALLFLATEGERPKVLLITSAMPNEGKSTVAANLSMTLALSGSRVLLVDGDLRKGRLDRKLHMQSEPGLSELLRQTCDPEKVIQTNSVPNLAFISCGRHSGNPGDLFLGSGLDKVLAQWRQEFDYVIIDSSPLFAADDASCLAPKVDGTLFVVRSHSSSARAVREALGLLVQRQAKVLGVIFNGTDASARSYYYYKYADYHSTTKPV